MKNAQNNKANQARDIIGNPQPSHSASLRLLAWATLKSERGQTICQRRLQSKPATQLKQVA